MSIQSATSGVSNAYSKQAPAPSPVQPAEQTKHSVQVAAASEQKSEAPKPVVNTSGHKTGSVINVTA